MKKKELFEQNSVLYNRLQSALRELEKYKQLYSENISEINTLRRKLAELETELSVMLEEKNKQESRETKRPEPVLPEKTALVTDEAECLDDAMRYGADVIGKIIRDGTRINNTFAEGSNALSIDLINLVLGKTEVCKAQIYELCRSEKPIDELKKQIDGIYTECADYFDSIVKQL